MLQTASVDRVTTVMFNGSKNEQIYQNYDSKTVHIKVHKNQGGNGRTTFCKISVKWHILSF